MQQLKVQSRQRHILTTSLTVTQTIPFSNSIKKAWTRPFGRKLHHQTDIQLQFQFQIQEWLLLQYAMHECEQRMQKEISMDDWESTSDDE